MMCVNAHSVPKYTYSAVFSARTLIRSTVLRSSFYGGLLSIVSLDVFAEPCDLGQGLREAINNSEHEGAVFRANFKNCATSLTGWEEGARVASNKDSEVSV